MDKTFLKTPFAFFAALAVIYTTPEIYLKPIITIVLIVSSGYCFKDFIAFLSTTYESTELLKPSKKKSFQNGGVCKSEGIQNLAAPTCEIKPNIYNQHNEHSDKSDCEFIKSIESNEISVYLLEKLVGADLEKAIRIRRQYFASKLDLNSAVLKVPYQNIDYSLITQSCCENVIGYVPLPLGYAGPLIVDDVSYFVPMATTEGALIASTNRGCRAITLAGGIKTYTQRDSMTRAPVVEFGSLAECENFCKWVEKNFRLIKQKFDSTSRFVSLKQPVECIVVPNYVYLRFSASTGDAMGMNMVSKATEAVLHMLQVQYFSHTTFKVVSLSGNLCADKKSSAINWINGRGKCVMAECTIPESVVSKVLKTTVPAMVHLHIAKNLVGSALSGSSGGFNAHAANIVTAIFIACGQDVAQTVSSSQCLTLLKEVDGNLRISCRMPCLEVGTVGGGTVLEAQKACLEMLGVAGGNEHRPGGNAVRLAEIICSTVVAGELSLLAALTTNDLVKSHMKYNRSTPLLPLSKEISEHGTKLSNCSINPTVLAKFVNKAAFSSSLHPTCSTVLT